MKPPPPTDIELAEQANSFHVQVINAQINAIHAARSAGTALLAAKRIVVQQAGGKRGTWTEWLVANFQASVQTARVYIRITAKWKELEPLISSIPHLSLNCALWILKVKREPMAPFEKQPMNDKQRCQNALIRSFGDFVFFKLTNAELIFLTGWGNFIGEHYSRFYREFLDRVKAEVAPIAEPFVEARDRRWNALKPLLETNTETKEKRRKIEDQYALDLAMAFRKAKLTDYQREVIYGAVECASKGVIPREVLSCYVPREPESPRDWINRNADRPACLRRAG